MKYLSVFLLCISLAVCIPRARVHAAATPVQVAEIENDETGSDDRPPVNTSVPTPTPSPTPTTTQPEPTPVVNSNVDAAPTIDTTVNTNTIPVDVTSVAPMTSVVTTQTSTTPPATISTNFPWAWVTSRATGIASFVLLGLLSATGILLTTGSLFRLMSPAKAWSFHRAIGTALLFSVLAHIASLLLDHFINLRLVDLLIPFVSPYKSLLLALGIIGFYILLLVLTTSLYTISSHAKFWRSVHFFSFPMYVLIFLHSYLVGTDTKEWWMQVVYWGSAAIIGAAVAYRLAWKYNTKRAPTPKIS